MRARFLAALLTVVASAPAQYVGLGGGCYDFASFDNVPEIVWYLPGAPIAGAMAPWSVRTHTQYPHCQTALGLIIGFTDPSAPLPSCACTLHASLDIWLPPVFDDGTVAGTKVKGWDIYLPLDAQGLTFNMQPVWIQLTEMDPYWGIWTHPNACSGVDYPFYLGPAMQVTVQ